MIHGTFSVKRVRETSTCILVEAARIMPGKEYKIYSPTLTPSVKYGSASSLPDPIDETRFDNKLKMSSNTKLQNFIHAKYSGEKPYEEEKYDADPDYKTPAGTRFTLTCLNGDPNDRSFK